jgi:hypothetical protein
MTTKYVLTVVTLADMANDLEALYRETGNMEFLERASVYRREAGERCSHPNEGDDGRCVSCGCCL